MKFFLDSGAFIARALAKDQDHAVLAPNGPAVESRRT